MQDEYGVKKKINKETASIPACIDCQVKDWKDFERLREERLQIVFDKRVPPNWNGIVEQLRHREYPLAIGGYPCGYYGFLRLLFGEERLLYSFYDQPYLIKNIMSYLTEFWISIWEEALAVIDVDCAHFWEDIAYHSAPLISPGMFHEFMIPCYQRITDFLTRIFHKV